MIVEQFYDTYPSSNVNVGETAGQFTEEFTKPIPQIYSEGMQEPITQEAYWLGWISYDNLPQCMKHSHYLVEGDGEGKTITFIEDTVQDNYPCGYVACTQANRNYTKAFLENGVPYTEATNTQINRFVNELHPEYSALSVNNTPISLAFLCYFTSAGAIIGRGNNNIATVQFLFDNSHNSGMQGLFDFLNGDLTLTFTQTIQQQQYTFDLDMSGDFQTGYGHFSSNEDSSIEIYMHLCYVDIPTPTFRNGSGEGALLTQFSAKINWNNEDDEVEGEWNVALGSTPPGGTVGRLVDTNESWSWSNPRWRGGVHGNFNFNEFKNLDYSNGYLQNGNIFAYASLGSGGSPHYTNVCLIYTVEDIIKQISLNYRVDFSTSETDPPASPQPVSYINGITYATDVSINDEFLARLKTGDITDPNFKNGLREWQYSSIQDSDFTEEDVPEPPEPEPGPEPAPTEPKITGDPTLGVADRELPRAGINYFALNQTDLSSFVNRLWAQPKNFYDEIQIAGKQQDSIFNYIACLRYFPLNYDWASTTVSPLHLGTGATFRESDGSTLYQLAEVKGHQDTGKIGTWYLNDASYHWRRNFLDYSPYLKMSIYLPYAGTIELNPEQIASHLPIWESSINLSASLDIPTGSLTYIVYNQSLVVLAQKTIKIAIDLPLAGNDEVAQSVALLQAQFSTIKNLLGMGGSIITEGATKGAAGAVWAGVEAVASLGDIYLQNSLAQKQIPVEIGSFGGVISNIIVSQIPYITIHRQKVSNPDNYGHTTGYLVEGTYKINKLNGLTICKNVDLSGIQSATDKEKAQIKRIMESGFYC